MAPNRNGKPSRYDELYARVLEAFGQDLVGCYDSALAYATGILVGRKDPKATPAEQKLERWAETLDPEAQRIALVLCEKAVDLALFCLLNHFDQTELGRHLPDGARYRLSVEMPPGTSDAGERGNRSEVELNPPLDPFHVLHESLPDWIERFSRFGPPEF